MQTPLFDPDQFAAITGAGATKIDYLVRVGIVVPAQPASRRGVSRKFDLCNVVEAMVGSELIEAGILADDVRRAVRKMRSGEQWPRLVAHDVSVSILAISRLSGFPKKAVSIEFLPADDVGTRCDTGYTILAAVPVAYILRLLEQQYPGARLA